MTYKEFTKIIINKRLDLGLTQKDMASLLKIDISTYSRLENGKIEPSFSKLILISKILNIDLNIIKKERSKPYYDFD